MCYCIQKHAAFPIYVGIPNLPGSLGALLSAVHWPLIHHYKINYTLISINKLPLTLT